MWIGVLGVLGFALILAAVGQGLWAALMVWIGLIALYVVVCRMIGKAAARKGRSDIAFFRIALLISPVLAGDIVASLAPVAGELRATPQATGPASDDVVDRVKRLAELRDAGLLT